MKTHSLCALFLTVLAALLLPSCQLKHPPIQFRTGTTSMQEANVEATCRAYQANPPTTVQEMQALLGGPPNGSYSDKKGDYAYWECFELDEDYGFGAAWAGILSQNGKIITSAIKHPKPFVERESHPMLQYGDQSLFDETLHPGMRQAQHKAWATRWGKQAAHYKREYSISPSGEYVCFVPPGKKFVRWEGEQNYVLADVNPPALPADAVSPAAQQPTPQPESSPNLIKTAADTYKTVRGIMKLFGH